MLNKAIQIAVKAHENQLDKAGEPYILHPLRVMTSTYIDTEIERICAVLHDVVEDSNYTFDDLQTEGFSDEVINILKYLTRRENKTYGDYIHNILENKTASRIKRADLIDNMNLSRIKSVTDKDIERNKRYEKALRKINENLDCFA